MPLAGLVSTKIHLIIIITSAAPNAIFWSSNKNCWFSTNRALKKAKAHEQGHDLVCNYWSEKGSSPPIYIIKENQK